MNILITGSQGYIGQLFIKKCIENSDKFNLIVGLDIRKPNAITNQKKVVHEVADIRSKDIEEIIVKHEIDTIVHLAAIISIAGTHSASFEYDVDVNGTYNLLAAAVKHKVRRFIHSSSGAAYGYWPSNVDTILEEDMPMLGNVEIPYSHHKYLVEEKLKQYRERFPEMEQFVFRVGTILGKTTKNPITDYLNKDKILCLKHYPSEFVAIWDEDLVRILFKATQDGKPGIYNLAGDGKIATKDLAKLLNKTTRRVSATFLRLVFRVLRPLRLIPYGPESIKFIQYRPVLSNEKLKKEFAYTPEKSSLEVFEYWRDNGLH